MAGILTRVDRGLEHFRTPEVPDLLAMAVEDGQHGHLIFFGRLGMVVVLEAGNMKLQTTSESLAGANSSESFTLVGMLFVPRPWKT